MHNVMHSIGGRFFCVTRSSVQSIFILERVICMRVSSNNLLELRFLDCLKVLFLKSLKQTFFAYSPDIIAGVSFSFKKDPEIQSSLMKNPRHPLGSFQDSRIIGGVVPQKPEIFNRLLSGILDLELQSLCPSGTHAIGLTKGIAIPAHLQKAHPEAPFLLPLG